MELNTIIEIIGSLGFPIVMCGALFWKMNKQDKDHKEEIDRLSSVIESNTLVMQKLVDNLEDK